MGIYQPPLSSQTNNSFSPISNDELSDEITLLAAYINAANHQFLTLIAEFDRREAWGGAGIRSCAHWLNWKCGIAIGAAREKVRVARCLEALPKIDEAFASGAISYSKTRAMTRVATAANEDYLLMIAQHGTASHVEKLVQKVQRVESLNKPNSEQSLHDAREFSSYQDEDGMWVIKAKLPPEVGCLVVKAIDEIVRAGESNKNVPAGTSEGFNDGHFYEEKDSFPMRKADALAVMAEHYLASAQGGTLAGSERCQVMLHVDVDTLKGSDSHAKHGLRHCHTDGHWIAPTTAKRLCCDASLVTVLEDDKGNVLNIGRRSRIIPPAIARALAIRDTSCRFPSCCATKFLDAHHIQHWADGGETKLNNLVTLCRHHHRLLHQGEFTLSVKSDRSNDSVNDANMVFTTRDGERIETNYFPQFPKSVPAGTLSAYFLEYFPAVNERTALSRWTGEDMDYAMAVDGNNKGLALLEGRVRQ